MSLMSWFDKSDVRLKLNPKGKHRPFFKRVFGESLEEPLSVLLREGSGIDQTKELIWERTAHQANASNLALNAILALDVAFCANFLRLEFGPAGAPPLGQVAICGIHRKNPIRRSSLDDFGDEEKILLSRFAYIHRLDGDLLLEHPLSNLSCFVSSELLHRLLFRCLNPVSKGELLESCPAEYKNAARELLGLLRQSGVLETVPAGGQGRHRDDEPAPKAMWDFHDALFHSESFPGFSSLANLSYGFGGIYPHVGRFEPLGAIHPSYPGKKIPLSRVPANLSATDIPLEQALRERKSLRAYDVDSPITAEELGVFLHRICRGESSAPVKFQSESPFDGKNFEAEVTRPFRAYPSGGGWYEQELYLSVFRCSGLSTGFYHYDTSCHSLVEIPFAKDKRRLFYETGSPDKDDCPDVLIHISARFQRMSWKYCTVAYRVMQQGIGGLYQTMYLIATSMGLAPCARGGGNLASFAALTGLDPWVEGKMGEFVLGRPARSNNP